MALTIVREKTEKVGSLKMVVFKITDSNGGGGTLEMSSYMSHIVNAHVQCISNATWISAVWTDDDETITIGAEGTTNDIYKVTVWGF